MDREPVDRITQDQHSLITTDQFLAVTGSESALRWAVRDQWLEHYGIWRGLYIVAGAPRTPYQPHMAACLLGGSNSAACSFAAAWLWDAPDIAECSPQITVFAEWARRIRGVRVHRCHLEGADWIDRRHGIPVATAPLVVVQRAQAGAGYLAERVANDLFKRKLTDPAAILRCLEPRVDGEAPAELEAFCERASRSRGHDDSPAARDLGAALLDAGVPPFVSQYPVTVEGHDYFLDFAWPSEMVGLEYNGWADHGVTRSAFDHDALRRSRLAAAGWRMLDATSAASRDAIIRWVLTALAATRSQS